MFELVLNVTVSMMKVSFFVEFFFIAELEHIEYFQIRDSIKAVNIFHTQKEFLIS